MKLSTIFIVFATIVRYGPFKMYLVSRTATFAKLFFMLCLCGLIMYLALAFYTFHLALSAVKKTNVQFKFRKSDTGTFIDLDTTQLKYILLWTTDKFKYKLNAEGEQIFIDNDCEHLNCYVTTNKTLLSNITKFNAIVFSISTLRNWNLPRHRSPDQKYVFFSTIPANVYPVCNVKADNFFNWTWTYKLHSDIPTPFLEVKDLSGHLIAPSSAVEWPANMRVATNKSDPNKRKAIMWYMDQCNNNHAKTFAKALKRHLPEHSMELDIYGCDNEKCPSTGCDSIIENYFFYMAFESSISDDYLTKVVLKGYHHNTVPVVVGGADYSKFLPPGSYVDARHDSPEKLASLLGYIARNPITYGKYFNWKKQYTINEANLQRGYCQLCDLLNNKKRTNTKSSYENFRKWWYYGNLQKKCFPKGAKRFDDLLSNKDSPVVRKINLP